MTAPGRIDKPTIFVSHAATDEPIASLLQRAIEQVFANGVNVFASSVPGTIAPGSDWLRSVRESLDAAAAVVVIVTPISIQRPWVWFEVGASWARMEQDKGRIYPLCVPEIALGELPEPLGRLQALSLGSTADVRQFFDQLITQFGFGLAAAIDTLDIPAQLPRYDDLPIAGSDRAGLALGRQPDHQRWLIGVATRVDGELATAEDRLQHSVTARTYDWRPDNEGLVCERWTTEGLDAFSGETQLADIYDAVSQAYAELQRINSLVLGRWQERVEQPVPFVTVYANDRLDMTLTRVRIARGQVRARIAALGSS
jgi:hypothetical protein